MYLTQVCDTTDRHFLFNPLFCVASLTIVTLSWGCIPLESSFPDQALFTSLRDLPFSSS